jgi:hypothetical protein
MGTLYPMSARLRPIAQLGIVGTRWAPGLPRKNFVVVGGLVPTGHVGTIQINIHFLYIY